MSPFANLRRYLSEVANTRKTPMLSLIANMHRDDDYEAMRLLQMSGGVFYPLKKRLLAIATRAKQPTATEYRSFFDSAPALPAKQVVDTQTLGRALRKYVAKPNVSVSRGVTLDDIKIIKGLLGRYDHATVAGIVDFVS